MSVQNVPQMANNELRWSTMVRENFEIHLSQMAKHALKLSPMVGEKVAIHLLQMAKHALKLSTMVGGCNSLRFTCFKWLKCI